jgi:DNA (cytosine-5)-methyltransferase 1
MGYFRAGFDVVGVDVRPQPNYPFRVIQEEALGYLRGDDFWEWEPAAIHASPPCQAYTQAQRLQGNKHPDLIAPTREVLKATGLPYVIENVPGSPLLNPVQVCGRGLGLTVKRHRLFESNVPLMGVPCQGHDDYITVFGHSVERRGNKRVPLTVAAGREAMGIDWMNRDELSESIPPAYCEFIGQQLLASVEASA